MRLDWIFLPKENPCAKFYIIIIISNVNRTEWSAIRSVIIQAINDCLITSMITDRIRGHEVLLLINHNFNKILRYRGLFFRQETPRFFGKKKEPFKRARDGVYYLIT